MHKLQEERLKYLADEKRIKAVTVLFSDLEGRCTCSTTTRSSC
jgi:glutamine synthetase